MSCMNITNEIKTNIHLYVILELTIKSVQHDKKLFESFKVKRPYLSFCNDQLEILNREFKLIEKSLYKRGVKYKEYQCINHSECLYSFNYRGQVVPFHYHGDILKEQVERKINLMWHSMKTEKLA